MSGSWQWVALPADTIQSRPCDKDKQSTDGASQATYASSSKDWDIHYHLGGTGPWIRHLDRAISHDLSPPAGCKIDQVHVLSRHNERYPMSKRCKVMTDLIAKLKKGQTFGSLAFVRDWAPFFDDAEKSSLLTRDGCHCGHDRARQTGLKFAKQYQDLLNENKASKIAMRASDCKGHRVLHTAEGVAKGMFGACWEDFISLAVIEKKHENGANTLKPSTTCINYRQDHQYGHSLGLRKLEEFQKVYAKPISKKLSKLVKDEASNSYQLTPEEIFTMQEMCGFETIVRGLDSPWCNVFNQAEWENFEYARDVYHFYRSGPGNKYSKILGAPWMRATLNLLADKESTNGPMFLSFSHDTDITTVLSLLEVLGDGTEKLPTHCLPSTRKWKTSQILCMGGRMILERFVRHEQREKEFFVRLIINDAVVAIPGCDNGPASSCPLPSFLNIMRTRLAWIQDFTKACGSPPGAPNDVKFLRQPCNRLREG